MGILTHSNSVITAFTGRAEEELPISSSAGAVTRQCPVQGLNGVCLPLLWDAYKITER